MNIDPVFHEKGLSCVGKVGTFFPPCVEAAFWWIGSFVLLVIIVSTVVIVLLRKISTKSGKGK